MLVHAGGKRVDRAIARCLIGGGNEVVCSKSPDDALDVIAANAVDLIFLDCTRAAEPRRILAAARGRIPVVPVADSTDLSTALELVCDYHLNNVIARRADRGGELVLGPAEVAITAEKLLRGDLFGLQKYVSGYGVELRERELLDSNDRDSVVTEVRDYLIDLGAGTALANALATVADELVTNAVFNAPRDSAGRALHRGRNRRESVALGPDEAVKIKYGCDGRLFGISVTDRFGSFTAEQLRTRLQRCRNGAPPLRQGSGGAGIGLFSVLNSCSQLVINVAPGELTEMIALVEIDRRMSALRAGGHSLHIFVEATERAITTRFERNDAVPAQIELSDTMRHELRQRAGVVRGVTAAEATEPTATPAALEKTASGRSGGHWQEAGARQRERAATEPEPYVVRSASTRG